MKPSKIGMLLLGLLALLVGCVPAMQSSQHANQIADQAMYQPVQYSNSGRKGPTVIVLPGQIKSMNATFREKVTSNNIADFGELELSNANFGVLERSDLGPLLDEVSLAVNMGDPTALQKFKRGKFKSTKWFVTFDVLKAEKVAEAKSGLDGNVAGNIFGALVGGRSGYVGDVALSSTKLGDSAGVWIVGMRYKIVDASTTEQVTTGYHEQKMEIGKKGTSFLGVSGSEGQMVTLDSLVQRLVQQCVGDIDRKK
ncbi:hypothetical protein [Desulfuromonas thiophila]|uniref:Curli production assembly/transport component CsgG n=1 Tax=Desulfuromonas thiophila TaxID=57664 RepID=A0A1G7EJ33_9BACT|nr:hypothetical protein [Desulfuromonas thiophila]SDE63673.1 hypothetical protein SAMN05661003_1214 [Desulfuromonas thiophila]